MSTATQDLVPSRTRGLIPFKPGPDPRRTGNVSAGASIIHWYNRMSESPERYDLEAIANDEREKPTKRLAAKSLLRSLSDGFAKNGRPLAADDLDRILDRTHGKATQRVEVTREEVKDPNALKLELLRMLTEHPELSAAIGARAQRALSGE